MPFGFANSVSSLAAGNAMNLHRGFGFGAGVNMVNGVGAAMYQPQIAATPAAQSRLSELMGRSQGTPEAQARLSELAGKDDSMSLGEGLSLSLIHI